MLFCAIQCVHIGVCRNMWRNMSKNMCRNVCIKTKLQLNVYCQSPGVPNTEYATYLYYWKCIIKTGFIYRPINGIVVLPIFDQQSGRQHSSTTPVFVKLKLSANLFYSPRECPPHILIIQNSNCCHNYKIQSKAAGLSRFSQTEHISQSWRASFSILNN